MVSQPGPRVNYDQIAHLYNEPIREHAADVNLQNFLAGRPDLSLEKARVLDMGCGTGSQLSANRGAYPRLLLVGLDRYSGMLRQAQLRGAAVHWVQGSSASTPLGSASFDYVTNQFSYQHIFDKIGVIRETYRVLKPGGRFVMTNIDPWSMPRWGVYKYFPAAWERDVVDFLPAETFSAELQAAGFVNIQVTRDHSVVKESLTRYLAYASQRHRVSQFMMIEDAEYLAGLDRIREDIAKRGADGEVASELCLITIQGDKAGAG